MDKSHIVKAFFDHELCLVVLEHIGQWSLAAIYSSIAAAVL